MAGDLGRGLRSDYASVATESDFPPGAGSTSSYPPEAAEWQCGDERLALRKIFNANEITAAALVEKYDNNRNKVLEPEELQNLLKDYHGGKMPKKDDLNFIMTVADKDHDSRISQDEMLFALRAWHAYINMPESVGAVFIRHAVTVDGDVLPSVEGVRDLLQDLNQQQPVGMDEAAYVRDLCLALGASERKVPLQKMRQAVSAWYLHIERGETARATLLQQAASSAHQKISGMRIFGRLCEGECDDKARGTRLVLVAFLCGWVVMPSVELVVATKAPTPTACEHPQMGELLWWTGFAHLAHTCGLVACGASQRQWIKSKPFRVGAWSCLAALSVAVVVLYWYGATRVISSTAHNCGFALWQVSQLVYIVIPFFLLSFALLGVPVLYCCVGSSEFFKAQSTDESLRKK